MTRDKLAKELGMTYQQVQKYEAGGSHVLASHLYLMANAFDITVEALFEGAYDV